MLIPKQKFSGHDSSFKHHQMRGKKRETTLGDCASENITIA
jgi:hypothetical protein